MTRSSESEHVGWGIYSEHNQPTPNCAVTGNGAINLMGTYYKIIHILAGWISLLIVAVGLLISALAVVDMLLRLNWGYTWQALLVGLLISGVAFVIRRAIQSTTGP